MLTYPLYVTTHIGTIMHDALQGVASSGISWEAMGGRA